MNYSGYSGRIPNYRSKNAEQHSSTNASEPKNTANPATFGQYPPTFHNRFSSPPPPLPWNAVPPSPLPRHPVSQCNVAPAAGDKWIASETDKAPNYGATFANNFPLSPFGNINQASHLPNQNTPANQHRVFTSLEDSQIAKVSHISDIAQTPSQNISLSKAVDRNFSPQWNSFPQQFAHPPPVHPLANPFPHVEIPPPRFNVPPPGFVFQSEQRFAESDGCLNPSTDPRQLSGVPSGKMVLQGCSSGANFPVGDHDHKREQELGGGLLDCGQLQRSQHFEKAVFKLPDHFAGCSNVINDPSQIQLNCVSINENVPHTINSNKSETGQGPLTVLLPNSSELKEDMEWIEKWSKRKQSGRKKENSKQTKILSMTVFRSLLTEAIALNNKLKKITSDQFREMDENGSCSDPLRGDAGDAKSPELQSSNHCRKDSDSKDEMAAATHICNENGDWTEDYSSSVLTIQKRLGEIKGILTEEAVSRIKEKLKNIERKRKRLKRKRQRKYEEEQDILSARAQIDREINNWQMGILEEQTKQKKDKEIKMAADETLFEVRRKLTEARRSLTLLDNIRKLRNIRKDKASRKGMLFATDSDAAFEERVRAQTDIWKRQINMYELEERTLEVMLETEHEANVEREKKLQKKKENEKIQKFEKQLQTWLFGKEEPLSPTDAVYPYRQYYDIGCNNLGALIRIRQDWDMYAVPCGTLGGSTIPFGWVTPVQPSSDVWASVLKE